MNHVELLNEMRGELRRINDILCCVAVPTNDGTSRRNLLGGLDRIDSLKRKLDEALSAVPVSKEEEEEIQKAVDENDGRIDVVETERQIRELPDQIENAFRNIPAVQSPDGTVWYSYYDLVHLFIEMEDWADTIRDYMGVTKEEGKKRESGFYWVSSTGEWTIAQYQADRDYWLLTGIDDEFEDVELDQIGEMIQRPEGT